MIMGIYMSNLMPFAIQLNLNLVLIFYSLSLFIGIIAVLLAIRKVNKIDPIIVFRS